MPEPPATALPDGLTAVLLVGGEGLRLRPLTEGFPKAMVPLLDRPQLAYVLDYLRSCGVSRAILACGYHAEAISAHFGESFDGLRIDYTVEPTPLGTAGAIALAARDLDRTFVALNGDSLRSASIPSLVEFHQARSAAATLLLASVSDSGRYGVVRTDRSGRVISFLEKPKPTAAGSSGGLINAGLYVLEPEVLDLVTPGRPASIEREIFPHLAERGSLYAAELPGLLIDMGTPAGYLEAHAELLAAGPRLDIHMGAQVAPDVALVAPVRIEEGARVGEGVRVGPAVSLGRGAVVGSQAEIRSSAVLAQAVVPANAVITDAIVTPDAILDGSQERRSARG
jgi:mannose-1-phosphate guanylyltransferase